MRLWPLCFFVIALVSCHSPLANHNNKVNIRLSTDSQTVYISGLEYAILHDLKADTLNNQGLQSLFAVYRMPADTDMKDLQKHQPGKYTVTDTAIIFKPDAAFAKHRQYFVRYYGGPVANSQTEVFQSKAKLEGQHFKEVIFGF
jgi:hypothetical protein